MRKLSTFIIAVLVSGNTFAQQLPQYTQYIFNNYLLNPALSGIENYIEVKGGYRNQWQGIDGGPVTTYISATAPIGQNFTGSDANAFPEQGNNPMSRNYVQTYRASEPHHGVGLHAVIDKQGPQRRTDLNVTYAYHLGLTEKLNVSVGIAAGISKIDLDASKITLGEEGIPDPAITGNNSQTKPDLAAGMWVYGPTFFAGISARQLLSQKLSFGSVETNNTGKLAPHMFFTAGYKLFLSDNIAAIPSVMVKYVSPAPLSYDANFKVAFQDRFWVGGSYRKDDSFAGLLGFNISRLFNLSYSYDFTTSDLKTVSDGSHEVVLGLLLNNRYKVTCPQKTF